MKLVLGFEINFSFWFLCIFCFFFQNCDTHCLPYLLWTQRYILHLLGSILVHWAAVAHDEEQLSANWKMGGLTPGLSGPLVEVSLGKTLNRMLPTDVSIIV